MKYISFLFLIIVSTFACTSKKKQQMRIVFKDAVADTLVVEPIDAVEKTVEIDSLYLQGYNQAIQEFYALNNFKTAWGDSKDRQDLLQVIADIKYDGIQSSIFDSSILSNYDQQYTTLADSVLVQADIAYTTTFNKLTQSLFNGILDPRKLYNDWDLEYHQINTAATLILVLDNTAVLQAFDSIRPHHKQYGRYRDKLKQYYALQDTSLSLLDSLPKPGKDYQELIGLKENLHFLGYWPDSIGIDPHYNKALQHSLEQFQQAHKLPKNNYVDSKAIEALEKEKQQLFEKLIVNLERFRWFPRKYGKDYILVNIPDFTLVSVANLDTIQKHNVIVGTPRRNTPILSSTLTTVVLNPTWTIPPTILKNDIVPKAKRNSNYFNSMGFTIYQNSTGKVVEPSQWDASRYNSYRYVQKGGPGNTLGRVKFMFKNNHSVYLHDTPNKTYFDKQVRDMSSGCVRVQNPFDLVEFIFELQDNDISKQDIDKILSSEKTTNISVSKNPIGVYLLYWTLNLDKKLYPTVIHDIYNYDNVLYKKLISK
ncbi:L,D-transpeptidase family protein [Myroides sp. LJL116]